MKKKFRNTDLSFLFLSTRVGVARTILRVCLYVQSFDGDFNTLLPLINDLTCVGEFRLTTSKEPSKRLHNPVLI